MIAQEQPSSDSKERALVAVVNWRDADRAALADKRSTEAQKAEYKQRNNLRAAADGLKGSQP